ncbi:hypothetical protein KGA65_20720 [Ideonella sp. B7]|uniref:hypothetical protein n=1 Tax=Ideonella benzenivorans TaxID=2831643 RepID=UPI001CEC8D68|nr:hypothetical protein [Ideonella benzenivorans]MCA6218973.1 hypothetical protein [Ideonella benzenivorans]
MTDDEIRAALGDLPWSIGREGRKWTKAEMLPKLEALPMKLEVIHGQLFWDDAERVRVVAALLEHLGLDFTLRVAAAAAETNPQANSSSTVSAPVERTWNYRAIRFEHGEDSYTAIHEVHSPKDFCAIEPEA